MALFYIETYNFLNIILTNLDCNDSLIKEILKMNEIYVYIKDFPDVVITETEIRIFSKAKTTVF